MCQIKVNKLSKEKFSRSSLVVMGGTLAQIFSKPEKNLEFFRLKFVPEMPTLVSLSD